MAILERKKIKVGDVVSFSFQYNLGPNTILWDTEEQIENNFWKKSFRETVGSPVQGLVIEITDSHTKVEWFSQNNLYVYITMFPVDISFEEVSNEHSDQFQSNLIHRKSNLITPERLAEIKNCLEEIHPGMWEVSSMGAAEKANVDSRIKYGITIHFPEVHMTSEEGREHDIKDLYICWYLDKNGLPFPSLYGTRTTISYAEYSSDYMHSHMAGGKTAKFTKMCLGGSRSGISGAVGHFFNNGWNSDKFMKALLLLYTYVGWESNSGGPYRSMRNIGSGRSRNRVPIDSATLTATIRPRLLETLTKDHLSIRITNDRSGIRKFLVDPNFGPFKEAVKMFTPRRELYLLREDGSSILYDRTVNGESQRAEAENLTASYATGSPGNKVWFRGEYISLTIESPTTEVEEVDESILIAPPTVVEMLATQLGDMMNEYYYFKSKE